nr:hypothetical protein [uncultured Thermanaerothrix sp.]
MAGKLLQPAELVHICRVNQIDYRRTESFLNAVDQVCDLDDARFHHLVNMPVERGSGNIGQALGELVNRKFFGIKRLKNAHPCWEIDDGKVFEGHGFLENVFYAQLRQ